MRIARGVRSLYLRQKRQQKVTLLFSAAAVSRFNRASVILIVAAVVGLIWPAASAKAYTPVCMTFTQKWHVTEASVSWTVANLTAHIYRCNNSKGYISATKAWVIADVTMAGHAGGFEFHTGDTYPKWTSPSMALYYTDAWAQSCYGVWQAKLCSYREDFRITERTYAPNFIGPKLGRWTIGCTNSNCHMHFYAY